MESEDESPKPASNRPPLADLADAMLAQRNGVLSDLGLMQKPSKPKKQRRREVESLGEDLTAPRFNKPLLPRRECLRESSDTT